MEIDGDSHYQESNNDKYRTNILNGMGIKVIRYTNCDVMQSIDGVYFDLIKQIEIRLKELNCNKDSK